MRQVEAERNIVNSVTITRYKQYASPGQFGPAWKWIYELPSREEQLGERTVTVRPGGFSTKSETLSLVRRLYSERPLLVEWPEGKATVISR